MTAVEIKESGRVLRAFAGAAVVATATRSSDPDAVWPGWTVSFPVASKRDAEQILRARAQACHDHGSAVAGWPAPGAPA